ncbi:AMP-dependent synthetase [Rhizocola hellebori]|uniref:AMP-dependent synthetase n=1 Tax=Rhizocola hellebori TaxID=1392758 RepID=A0A8J3VKF5_9ACTN|nr:long-chain fatty acid--CoA ligase [Rhizocola hellebori]GIH10419.1 AMP-dependent synthetase [Rhizocola hellebori]
MTFNLATILAESASAYPDRAVAVLEGRKLTYAELDAASGRVAGALLGAGLHCGDRVGVQLPNSFEFLYAYFGILKAGLVMVPINPQLKAAEIGHMMEDSGAALLIDTLDDPLLGSGSAVPMALTQAGDTAVIIYTSGTTGKPKGAELSHFQLYLNCTIAGETFGVRPEDVSLAALPFFHIYGLSGLINCAVRYGGAMVLVPRFEPQAVFDLIAEHRITVLAGVPTMYHALWMAEVGDRDLSCLRLASSGGASMPEALLTGFEKKFGVVILEGYGMSETGSTATMNQSATQRKPLSVGKPIWGVQCRIVSPLGDDLPDGSVGELWLRGHVVMKGYFGNPLATAETVVDGWLRTGDLAYRDPDGFLFLVDRIKDLIIRGGYNVYPREVEEVLYGHPAVAEAAVIGRPDDRLGEEVVAVVAPKPGCTIDVDELIAHCRERLALYKCPREVRVLASLPKSDTGKLLKRELRR